MPITYRIDRQRGRVVTTCTGQVTLRDVMAHFDALEKDPERPVRLDVLLDLTEQESTPVAPQMQAAADRVALVADLVFGNGAVVATRESLFGMARMFEVLARGHFASIRTFRNRREAEEWLDSL
ncbi:MAG TPA: STAS/SEC14 domain-containing protein [Thermoanaerobaculia bacterium]|nr:STAS/SEC14 domain-containing protein [Thermoanaerobaculia bacterium]